MQDTEFAHPGDLAGAYVISFGIELSFPHGLRIRIRSSNFSGVYCSPLCVTYFCTLLTACYALTVPPVVHIVMSCLTPGMAFSWGGSIIMVMLKSSGESTVPCSVTLLVVLDRCHLQIVGADYD